jgi:hypothetical protein
MDLFRSLNMNNKTNLPTDVVKGRLNPKQKPYINLASNIALIDSTI